MDSRRAHRKVRRVGHGVRARAGAPVLRVARARPVAADRHVEHDRVIDKVRAEVAAVPPLDPPGVIPSFHGFFVTP